MKLTLKRIARREKYTIGHLYIDGKQFCDTLEDTDRGLDSNMTLEEIKAKKKYGETAIPTGTYRLDMKTVSPKLKDKPYAKPYGGILPRFIGIRGYSGVLIHPGNSPEDTAGCILVGRNTVKGRLTHSTETYIRLMDQHLIPARDRGETITIQIK